MRMTCKCHGVSGACTTKTCWRQLADLRTVGTHLRRKYTRAVKADFQNGILHKAADTKDIPTIRKTELVYLEKSPDYCRKNLTLGTPGTLGRRCIQPDKTDRAARSERRSCKRLCSACGFKVKKTVRQVRRKCNCKFLWCCAVKCEICEGTEDILTCTL